MKCSKQILAALACAAVMGLMVPLAQADSVSLDTTNSSSWLVQRNDASSVPVAAVAAPVVPPWVNPAIFGDGGAQWVSSDAAQPEEGAAAKAAGSPLG